MKNYLLYNMNSLSEYLSHPRRLVFDSKLKNTLIKKRSSIQLYLILNKDMYYTHKNCIPIKWLP